MAQTRTLSDVGWVWVREELDAVKAQNGKGREKRNQCPRFCHQTKALWQGRSKACWSGPCRFHHLFSPIRHYFPDWRAVNWSAAGAAHGNCTPPRIAPSCTDVLHVSLCRSTIVGRWGHGETACHGCFWMNGYRWAPSGLGPALTRDIPRAGGHGAFSASLSSFQEAHLLM